MVVRIRQGSSIRGALSYNERKVTNGSADLILAVGFACDVRELCFAQKLRRYQLLVDRQRKRKTNTLHISLNFAPGEKLTRERMKTIAMDYMTRIGFSGQPFLVYQHHDTNHPHLHIVTTNIVSPTSHIETHNLAKRLSNQARKDIELAFGLVQAERSGKKTVVSASPMAAQPVRHGKEEIKHAITNLLGEVLRRYKFTSLDELNLILRDMNLVADRGKNGSRMFEAGGLVYSLLDADGHRTGVAIKASDIYGKPTLAALERKFAQNAVKKLGAQHFTAQSVASALQYGKTAESFQRQILLRRLSMREHYDPTGILDRINFVDHRNGTVLSHQDLGIALTDLTNKAIAPSPRSRPDRKLPRKARASDQANQAAAYALSQALAAIWLSGGSMGAPEEYPRKRKKKKKRPPL